MLHDVGDTHVAVYEAQLPPRNVQRRQYLQIGRSQNPVSIYTRTGFLGVEARVEMPRPVGEHQNGVWSQGAEVGGKDCQRTWRSISRVYLASAQDSSFHNLPNSRVRV